MVYWWCTNAHLHLASESSRAANAHHDYNVAPFASGIMAFALFERANTFSLTFALIQSSSSACMSRFRCESPETRTGTRDLLARVACNLQRRCEPFLGHCTQIYSNANRISTLNSESREHVLVLVFESICQCVTSFSPSRQSFASSQSQVRDIYLGEETYGYTFAERLALGFAFMHLTWLSREGGFDRSPLPPRTSSYQ